LSEYIKFPCITNSRNAAYELNAASRDAWAKWLSAEKWDVFLTLTDPGLSHPEHMLKRWRYVERSINEGLYGKNFRRRNQGIETIVGLERQKRGSVHAHGLIRLPNHDARDPSQFSLAYWQAFCSKLGIDKKTGLPAGWAMLDIPRSNDDVVAYVSKYVVKDGELVIGPNFSPNNPRSFGHTLLALAN
jgi:hypothetical protein